MGTATQWVDDFSPGTLQAIGVLELLSTAGLVPPALPGIAPVLVPLAATGPVLPFVGAVITRLRHGEKLTIAGALVHLGLAAFVAWAASAPSPSSADHSAQGAGSRRRPGSARCTGSGTAPAP
ncbi:DoxX family protein [Streptomyces sp. TUS-ST3]|uniref:DoxX family protein n=1 Tax=Streptomyces sp. TUS-ST3 TaxID=3025591 RepID=UPI0024E1176D|nr:DoxX family protein [Streptomyces sp. TUS-ST3]